MGRLGEYRAREGRSRRTQRGRVRAAGHSNAFRQSAAQSFSRGFAAAPIPPSPYCRSIGQRFGGPERAATLRFSEGCSLTSPDAAAQNLELSGRLAAAGLAERRQLLDGVVRDAVGAVLKITPSRLDPRKALGTMGLNSLMAMELRNRLEVALGRPLSATLAWNYPTVEALVAHLAGAEPAAVTDAHAAQISTASHRPVRPHQSSGGSFGRASCCGVARVTTMGREMNKSDSRSSISRSSSP